MLVPSSKCSALLRLVVGGLAAMAASVCAPSPANAHFVLTTPAATMNQGSLGDPQKAAPCGDDGSGMPTGKVTAFQAGQTITITIEEKIFHEGHYRISLGMNGPMDIPVEPVVTPGANTPCGTAAVESTPVFPVLADGVLDHKAAFSGPQTITVTLPDNVTCDHCTLQVLEFMSNHPLNVPGGCYYHHCANVSISGGADPTTTTGGATSTGESSATSGTSSSGTTATATATGAGGASATGAGGGPSSNESSGCSFNGVTSSSAGITGLASLLALTALARRRRR
jgi:MYXO-CTERM domain-containing protein